MAIEHRGKNKHAREGRPSPHGAGAEETDRSVTGEHAGEQGAEGERSAPPAEYKRERTDVPGLKKTR